MKTTLEIPDSRYRMARATAARQGRSMKEFFVEALTEKLEGKRNEQGWRSVLGRLGTEGTKAAREVDAVVKAADFNKIDHGDWQ